MPLEPIDNLIEAVTDQFLVLDCTDAQTSLASNERRRYQDQVTKGLQAEIIAHAA